jgi:ABC-type glycerol-3-phosphate transport system substrate-binding protein
MDAENNLTWITEGGKVPTKKSIINGAEFKNAELLIPFSQMDFQYFPKTTITGVINTALQKAMGEIVVNKMPVQAALDEATKTINKELSQK